MTHKFAELEEKMSSESRARVGRAVQEALKELPPDLRNACDRSPPLQSLAQKHPAGEHNLNFLTAKSNK